MADLQTSLPSPPTALPSVPGAASVSLSPQQKAAVIVRLLLNEGASLPLSSLNDSAQAALTAHMADLRFVDHATLNSVVEEFLAEISSVGLSFPDGLQGALDLLGNHLSPGTAARLRREAGLGAQGDPWDRLSALEPERLLPILEAEGTEVGAVMLSKLDAPKAALILGKLPADRARRISYAISRTGKVAPETVRRIGLSLAAQIDAEPVTAFESNPVDRIGAILNSSRAATRDDVLAGLAESDADFAGEVKRAIFTFANIPDRIGPLDIPRIIRGVDPEALRKALAGAQGVEEEARDFILNNISKRMADTLREEMAELGKISEGDTEDAMFEVIAEIRRLTDAGELTLVAPETAG